MDLSAARAGARAARPEARVIEAGGGRCVVYVGGEEALKTLEASAGSRYVEARKLKLAEPTPGVATWLLLPTERVTFLLLETVGKLDRVNDAYLKARAEAVPVNLTFAEHYPPPPAGLPEPFKHQVECFSEALTALDRGEKGYGVWLDMGLGKTKLACDIMNALQPTVSLVLIQKITQQQWKNAIQSGFPDAELLILDGPIKERSATIKTLTTHLKAETKKRPVVLLLNWDVLYRLQADLTKLGTQLEVVIADEATKLKNRNSQVSKAARKLARNAKLRIPMTGTPMTGDPGDLWALFDFQDEDAFGLTYWEFMKRYCHLGGPFSEWEFAGLKRERLPELVETIYARAYRQTKAAVTDMPEKLYQKVDLELKGEQKEHYRRVADRYCTQVTLEDGRQGELTVSSAIAKVTRLQQIAAGILRLTSLTVGEGEEAEVYGGGVKEITSAKTAWVVEYCKESNETTDVQGVIWTKFVAEADRVQQELVAAGVEAEIIDGRTKQVDRERILDRFSDRETPLRWLVINVSAGAYGLDLPSADVLLYHSSTHNLMERMQSEDRGHRVGRVRPYIIYDLVCKGTVDVDIYRAYQEKTDLIRMLISKGTPK